MPKRAGSGRKACSVAVLFKDIASSSKMPRVECTFCSKQIAKNGTIMSKHLQDCKKCPSSVKEKYTSSQQKNQEFFEAEDADHPETVEVLANIPEDELSNAAVKPRLKASGLGTFIDKMNPENQERADELLGRAIFASRAPLSMVDNPYWREFMSFLRPAFKIPSRHMVSGPLLEKEYKKVSALVAEAIAAADSVALAVDGWSNIRNEPIVNFVVTTPKVWLYKVLPTRTSSHTAEFMAKEISSVIDEIGPQKVFGLVTDNAANMKATWKLLEEKYTRTNLFTYGCLAHSLQLIFTDLKALPSLNTLVADATACIKAIKNSHKLNAAFIEKQVTAGTKTSLKLPVATRWGSLVSCLESLRENKPTIRAMAIDENLSDAINKNDRLKKNMLNDVFWDKVAGFSSLLKPMSTSITIVESDTPRMSSVLGILKKIENDMESQLLKSPLLKSEEQNIRDILKKRKQFCVYDVHKIANLLDPQLRGCDLTPEEETDVLEKIYDAAVKMPHIDENNVLAELANYNAKQDFFSKTFLWSSVKKLSPVAWWAGFCKSTALSQVAIKFLTLPTTSAACERTFSTYSDVHSRKRNKLTNERAGKIVYIAHNLKLQSQELLPKPKQEHPGEKEPAEKEVSGFRVSEDSEETEEEMQAVDSDSDVMMSGDLSSDDSN